MLCIFCKDNYSFSITEKKLPKKNNFKFYYISNEGYADPNQIIHRIFSVNRNINRRLFSANRRSNPRIYFEKHTDKNCVIILSADKNA